MDDKGTKEYAVTVTIIVLMLFMGPYITEAPIIYMNDLAGINRDVLRGFQDTIGANPYKFYKRDWPLEDEWRTLL